MTVLIPDINDRLRLYDFVFECLQIPACLFLLAIIVPLYKVAKERMALYILFSKSFFTIINQSTNSIYRILWDVNNGDVGFYKYVVYAPIPQCLGMISNVHVLALAINRFTAVFLPFKYMHIFTKRNTFIYILIFCTIGIILGIPPRSPTYFYGIFFNMNVYVNNVTLFGCSFAYCTMLAKFIQERIQNQNLLSNSQLEKNRIMLSFVCFTPQLPALLGQIIQLVLRVLQPEAGSLENIALSIGLSCCVVSAQFVEELCLIMFCDDFRVQIRKQYSFFFKQSSAENTTNTVTTHTISVRSSTHQDGPVMRQNYVNP